MKSAVQKNYCFFDIHNCEFIIQKLKSKHTSLKKYTNIFFSRFEGTRGEKTQIFRTFAIIFSRKCSITEGALEGFCFGMDFFHMSVQFINWSISFVACFTSYLFWMSPTLVIQPRFFSGKYGLAIMAIPVVEFSSGGIQN